MKKCSQNCIDWVRVSFFRKKGMLIILIIHIIDIIFYLDINNFFFVMAKFKAVIILIQHNK